MALPTLPAGAVMPFAEAEIDAAQREVARRMNLWQWGKHREDGLRIDLTLNLDPQNRERDIARLNREVALSL
jgi:hypothetical protein